MSTVAARITRAPACDVINLTEAEKDIYTGAGWKLANFANGRLVAFFDPSDTPYSVDTRIMVDNAIDAAMRWLAGVDGEVWLVLCSCYQLCEPREITPTDASALAHMSRMFGDQFYANANA